MELLLIAIGILTVVLSILAKVVGFPDQIRKNWLRKSTEGVSVIFYIISFSSYILWTLYGALTQDWVVYVGQGLGVLTTGIILWQMYLYRKK